MVSLPSKWIKQFNLKKGDEISIEEVENSLLISKESKKEKKKVNLNLTNYTESAIRTGIINSYRSGVDIIEINFKDESQYKIILNTINNYLIGFDVIKKEKNICIIENITEPSEEQFDVLFRKILYNISLLINGTEARLKEESKFEDYEEIVLSIHKYDNFCRRVISKQNTFGNESKLFWTFSGILIHGQRELYHLNKFLDKNKVNFKNFEFFSHLKKAFDLLSQGYVQKNISKLEELHELEKKIIYSDFYKLIQTNKKENIVLYHLAVAIKDFYLASSPLVGLLLSSNNSKWTFPSASVI